MAILCPHCGEDQDSYATVRMGDLRWHKRCWLPWLANRVEKEMNTTQENSPHSMHAELRADAVQKIVQIADDIKQS
jgi:hypothetical protein